MSDQTSLSIVLATPEQLGLVNRFYRANGHKGKCGRSDRVYMARTEHAIAAAVRFTQKGEVWLLRGLWVATNQRRMGMGGQLLSTSLQDLQQPVWCYPYAHLVTFYRRHGFLEISPEQAPDDIAGPWRAYKRKGEDFALMRWQP